MLKAITLSVRRKPKKSLRGGAVHTRLTDNNPGRGKTYEVIGPTFELSGSSGYDVCIRCQARLRNGGFGEVKAVFSNPLFRFSEKIIATNSASANVSSVKTADGQSLGQGADNNDDPIKAHDDVHDLATGNKPLNINGQSNPSRTIVNILDITNHVNFNWSWFKDKTVTMTYVSTGENLDVHVHHTFFGVEFAPKEISFSDEVSGEVVGLLTEPVEVVEHLLTQKAGLDVNQIDLTDEVGQNIVPNGEFISSDLSMWQPIDSLLEVYNGRMFVSAMSPYGGAAKCLLPVKTGMTYDYQIKANRGYLDTFHIQFGTPENDALYGHHFASFEDEYVIVSGTLESQDTTLMVILGPDIGGSDVQVDYVRITPRIPATFPAASTTYTALGYKMDGLVSGDLTVREALRKICHQIHARLFTNCGLIKLVAKSTALAPVKALTKPDLQLKSIAITRQPIKDVKNSISLGYSYDWLGKQDFRKNVTAEDQQSITRFGNRLDRTEHNFDLISDDAMAASVAAYYLALQAWPSSFYHFTAYLPQFELECEDCISLTAGFHGLAETPMIVRAVDRVFGSGKNRQINHLEITAEQL